MLAHVLSSNWRALALALPALIAFAVPAHAIQCDEVTEYAETWVGDVNGSSFPLYGRGVADGGGPGPCSITERTSITAPSGSEVAAAIGQVDDHAESTVTVYIDEGSEDGQYTTTAVAWSQGVYYGCGTQVAVFTGFVARYFYLGEHNGMHGYGRYNCYHGCQDPWLDLPSYIGEYARVAGKYVNLVFVTFCHGWATGQDMPPTECYGPPS